jgi:hypothetical protein
LPQLEPLWRSRSPRLPAWDVRSAASLREAVLAAGSMHMQATKRHPTEFKGKADRFDTLLLLSGQIDTSHTKCSSSPAHLPREMQTDCRSDDVTIPHGGGRLGWSIVASNGQPCPHTPQHCSSGCCNPRGQGQGQGNLVRTLLLLIHIRQASVRFGVKAQRRAIEGKQCLQLR